jgi:hypothetical protein
MVWLEDPRRGMRRGGSHCRGLDLRYPLTALSSLGRSTPSIITFAKNIACGRTHQRVLLQSGW